MFYGIGDALAGEGGLEMAIIFLQLALYLEPDFPLAYAALAEAYDSAKKYELECRRLARSSEDSPLWMNVQIQKASRSIRWSSLMKPKRCSKTHHRRSPTDVRPLDALGNILRSHERYGEAATITPSALRCIPKPTKDNWTLFYSRGVCYERMKHWPAAEADFKQALVLSPGRVAGAQLSRLFLGRSGHAI